MKSSPRRCLRNGLGGIARRSDRTGVLISPKIRVQGIGQRAPVLEVRALVEVAEAGQAKTGQTGGVELAADLFHRQLDAVNQGLHVGGGDGALVSRVQE